MASIPYIHMRIENGDLERDAVEVGVQAGLVAADDPVDVIQFKDGITNKLLKVSSGKTIYLVRVYGNNTHLIIDRESGSRNMSWLHTNGLAAPLYAHFDNGLVYGFIAGVACSCDDLAQSDVFPAIAKHLATWHTLPVTGNAHPTLFDTMNKWLQAGIVSCSSDEEAILTYMLLDNTVPTTSLPSIYELRHEFDILQRHLPHSPIAFTHNDLLCANIVLQRQQQRSTNTSTNSDYTRARFIDYEYSSVGYIAFDIANHFNEFASFDCDWSKYPSPTLQKQWISIYLSHLGRKDLNQMTTEELYKQVKSYTLASHLLWTLWALVQSTISDINFDYTAYAMMRWKRYQHWKQNELHWDSSTVTAVKTLKKIDHTNSTKLECEENHHER